MTVCLVAAMRSTLKQGSSSCSLCEAVENFVSSAWFLSSTARPNMGLGRGSGLEVDAVELVAVVEDAVEVDLLDLGDGADVAGAELVDLVVLLALELEQVADAERLLVVVDEELGLGPRRCPSGRGRRRACRRRGRW